MPISTKDNPGKYDNLCTEARLKAKAHSAVLIILGGDKGFGFSVQMPEKAIAGLPAILEHMAAEIRRDMQSQTKNHDATGKGKLS